MTQGGGAAAHVEVVRKNGARLTIVWGGQLSTLPSILSAGAATLAAVLAGLTLYATGRRETRKWFRDSLAEHYVEFLTSSFSGAGQRAHSARVQGDAAALSIIADNARQAYMRWRNRHSHTAAYSGAQDVVSAAEALHVADFEVSTAMLTSDSLPREEDWRKLRDNQRAARAAMLVANRKSLGLGDAAPIRRLSGRIEPG